jgi:hypothetical protein
MHNRYRRFIMIVLLPVLLLLPAGAANWKFLLAAGELTSIEDVAAIQQQKGGLYGTALHPNVYPYKLELFATRKPEIVVIGSSRVLQFRQDQFSRPFANLGRTINYPAEAVKLVQDMLAIGTPRIVLFGIDHYWLNPAYTTAPDFRTHNLRGGSLTPDALMAPFRWLLDGRVSPRTYRSFLAGNTPVAPNGEPLIGIQAIQNGAGFGPDGSWYYDHYIYGRRAAEDPGFRDTLRRITTSSSQFRHGSAIDPDRVEELETAIRLLRQAGAHVITFVPPMSERVRREMELLEDAYGYAGLAREALAALHTPHADLLDGDAVGIEDCEFVDGFHVGDVGIARLLVALARNPESQLADVVDLAHLRDVIAREAGHATADRRFRRDGEVEIDFLGLGCTKQTP